MVARDPTNPHPAVRREASVAASKGLSRLTGRLISRAPRTRGASVGPGCDARMIIPRSPLCGGHKHSPGLVGPRWVASTPPHTPHRYYVRCSFFLCGRSVRRSFAPSSLLDAPIGCGGPSSRYWRRCPVAVKEEVQYAAIRLREPGTDLASVGTSSLDSSPSGVEGFTFPCGPVARAPL